MKFLILVISVLCTNSVMALDLDFRPDSITSDWTHVSHLTQHEPFTDHPTNYGFNALFLTAHWNFFNDRLHLSISEGAVIEQCQYNWCGGLAGKRETFKGTLEYNIWSKH